MLTFTPGLSSKSREVSYLYSGAAMGCSVKKLKRFFDRASHDIPSLNATTLILPREIMYLPLKNVLVFQWKVHELPSKSREVLTSAQAPRTPTSQYTALTPAESAAADLSNCLFWSHPPAPKSEPHDKTH